MCLGDCCSRLVQSFDEVLEFDVGQGLQVGLDSFESLFCGCFWQFLTRLGWSSVVDNLRDLRFEADQLWVIMRVVKHDLSFMSLAKWIRGGRNSETPALSLQGRRQCLGFLFRCDCHGMRGLGVWQIGVVDNLLRSSVFGAWLQALFLFLGLGAERIGRVYTVRFMGHPMGRGVVIDGGNWAAYHLRRRAGIICAAYL